MCRRSLPWFDGSIPVFASTPASGGAITLTFATKLNDMNVVGVILFAAGGITLLGMGIRSLVKGSFYGNLYKVRRESMPHRFYYCVVTELLLGAFFLFLAGVLLIQEMKQ